MDLKFKDNSKLKLASFTQLEYIESTGTQWIDTGWKLTSTAKVVVNINATSQNDSYMCVFGSQNANGDSGGRNMALWRNGTSFCVQLGPSWGGNFGTFNLNTFYTIEESNGNFSVDGNLLWEGSGTLASGNYSIWIFSINRANSHPDSKFKGKLSYAKIYDNGVLVREFIPCKDPNGVVCLYDTVSEQFFYNAGTGDFVAGPVVKSFLPETFLLKTTTLYHKNTPNVDFFHLVDGIVDYQKTHQDEVKEYYYPTTQLWQDIIIEYPDILYWYNIDHKFCIYICESDDPEQCAEDFLDVVDNIKQELDDYPDLIPIIAENPGVASVIAEYPSIAPIIAENPSIAPIIADNPEVVHSLVDTGYVTSIKGNGAQYIDTGLAGNSAMEIQLRLKYGTGAQDLILGNSWTGLAYIVHRNGNTIRAYWGGSADFAVSDITKFINIVYKSNYASVDNVSKEIAGNPSLTTGTLKLLGFGNNYNNQYSQLNYYKRYDDNVLIQWLVPIQNNGNPCMIDLLTGTKYLNQGTGNFTYSLEPKS